MFPSMFYFLAVLFVVVAVLFNLPRADIPSHFLGHPYLQIPQIIPTEMGASLNEILRELKDYPTNINADLKTGFSGAVEHIGEATAILPGGKCDHPLLVPNVAKTECILPQRVDVGKHFIMTGGPDAIREDVKDMTSRVQSFARYMTGDSLKDHPVIQELFNALHFIEAARTICPAEEQVLDPFQFTFLLQIPGQTGVPVFATHLCILRDLVLLLCLHPAHTLTPSHTPVLLS